MSTPGPELVSHLLAADDALIPGRWGAHITLCGLEVRGPNTTAAEDECCADFFDCDVARFCPACVREAARWSAETGDRASGAVDQRATR